MDSKLTRALMIGYLGVLGLGVLEGCVPYSIKKLDLEEQLIAPMEVAQKNVDYFFERCLFTHIVDRDIKIRNYFSYIQEVASDYTKLSSFPITEHILVRANSWIIDSLENTDHYRMMATGLPLVYDQRDLIILHKDDTLFIPNERTARAIQDTLDNTTLYVNIPEFELSIVEFGKIQYTFPVRVGVNKEKYLATAGEVIPLRTAVGIGEIVRIERNPWFVNPETGKPYKGTNRDDGTFTKIPQIPWMEPEINGIRYGHLIHSTTNPQTLGRPYSHGCIGTKEADAWRIYYNSELGTKVVFDYNLDVTDSLGNSIRLRDIYDRGRSYDLDRGTIFSE